MSTLEEDIERAKALNAEIQNGEVRLDEHRWELARLTAERTFTHGANGKAAQRERAEGRIPRAEWASAIGCSPTTVKYHRLIWERYGSGPARLCWSDGRVLSFADHRVAVSYSPELLADMMAQAEAKGIGLGMQVNERRAARRNAKTDVTPEQVAEAIKSGDNPDAILEAVVEATKKRLGVMRDEADTASGAAAIAKARADAAKAAGASPIGEPVVTDADREQAEDEKAGKVYPKAPPWDSPEARLDRLRRNIDVAFCDLGEAEWLTETDRMELIDKWTKYGSMLRTLHGFGKPAPSLRVVSGDSKRAAAATSPARSAS